MSNSRIGEPVSTTASADSELLDELWLEYKRLIRQGRRRDVALEMRLKVVMMDLGLYRPSPP